MKKYSFYIGIDCGVETGYAIWDRKKKALTDVRSIKIHQAMMAILLFHRNWIACGGDTLLVRVEDARLRKEPKSYGPAGPAKLQGVGSVKRDAKIWEDFLTDHKIPFEMVHPRNNKTKMKQDYFKKVTGWKLATNEHARDAATLVFGM